MSITTMISALQTVHKTITGVTSAPTAMPSNLNTAVQPIVLVWPGEATWAPQALGYDRQDRTYEVRCYVQPVGQDKAGPENGYAACITLLQRFGEKYLDDLTLGGVADHIASMTDSGVLGGGPEMTFAGVAYWGFVFRLTIVEKSQ